MVRLMNGSLMTTEPSNRTKSWQDTKETTGGGGGGGSRLEMQEKVMSVFIDSLSQKRIYDSRPPCWSWFNNKKNK